LIIINAEPFVGGTFIDTSGYARVVTNVGVTQSAAQVWKGTQSMEFNAGADNLSIPDDPVWTFPGDFTISVWVYVVAYPPANFYIFSQEAGIAWRLYLGPTGSTGWTIWNGGATPFAVITGAGLFPTAAWAHVEVSRVGNTGRIWIDGINRATDATAAGAAGDSAVDPSLGSGASPGVVGYYDAWTITSGGWPRSRNRSPPNRRW